MKRKLKKEFQELLRLDSPEINLAEAHYKGFYWSAKERASIHKGFFKTEQEAIEWADKYCEPVEDLESCIERMANEYENDLISNKRCTFYGFLRNVYKGDWQEEIKQAVLNSK